MDDGGPKGCLYALAGAALLALIGWWLGSQQPPPIGPSCYEVAQTVRARGSSTRAQERFLDKCAREIAEDERINRRY